MILAVFALASLLGASGSTIAAGARQSVAPRSVSGIRGASAAPRCYVLPRGFDPKKSSLCPVRNAGFHRSTLSEPLQRRLRAADLSKTRAITADGEPCNIRKLDNGYTLYRFGVEPDPEPIPEPETPVPATTGAADTDTRQSAQAWIDSWKASTTTSATTEATATPDSSSDTRPSAQTWIDSWKSSRKAAKASTPDTSSDIRPSAQAWIDSWKSSLKAAKASKAPPVGGGRVVAAMYGDMTDPREIEIAQKKKLAQELRDRRRMNAEANIIQAQLKRDPQRVTEPVRFRFRTDDFLGLSADRIVEAQTGDNMLEVFDKTGGIIPSFCCEGICYTCVAQLQGLDSQGNRVGDPGVVRCCITEVVGPPAGATEIEVTIPEWVKEDD